MFKAIDDLNWNRRRYCNRCNSFRPCSNILLPPSTFSFSWPCLWAKHGMVMNGETEAAGNLWRFRMYLSRHFQNLEQLSQMAIPAVQNSKKNFIDQTLSHCISAQKPPKKNQDTSGRIWRSSFGPTDPIKPNLPASIRLHELTR